MKFLNQLNQWVGDKVAWLNLFLVLVTFAIVVFRYAFGLSWVWLQELVLYMHATIFMTAVGFTLSDNQHVKVDIFYTKMSPKKQAMVNFFGTLVFLFPFCGVMLVNSWPYVMRSWQVMERSGDANGLAGVYLIKTLLIIYPVLLLFQGLYLMSQSFKQWRAANG